MFDFIPRIIDINEDIKTFSVKQGDNNSRKIFVTLKDRDNPNETTVNLDGCAVRAYFALPDGSSAYVDGAVESAEDGVISVTLPSGVTAQSGTVQCEINISDAENETLLSLHTIKITVIESIRDTSAIEASDEFTALDNALIKVDVINARIDSIVAGETSGSVGTEIADARINYDGTITYGTVGEAIRKQILAVMEGSGGATDDQIAQIEQNKNDINGVDTTIEFFVSDDYEIGNIDQNGIPTEHSMFWRSKNFETLQYDLYLENPSAPKYSMTVYKYDAITKEFISRELFETAEHNSVLIEKNDDYVYKFRFGDTKWVHDVDFVENEFIHLYKAPHTDGIKDTLNKISNDIYGGITKSDFICKLPRLQNYESWAKMYFDNVTNSLLILYTTGVDHAGINKAIRLCVFKDDKYKYYTVDASNDASIKGIGIVKNGDTFVVMATFGNSNVDNVSKVYRYTSKNLNDWTKEEIDFPFSSFATGAINIDNLSKIGNRIFTNLTYYTYETKLAYICYTDDFGTTWHKSDNIVADQSKVPCEPIFIEIGDRVVMLARNDIPNASVKTPLLYAYSEDNGDTWSEVVDCNGISNANASNLSAIRYGKNKMILLYGSRYSADNGIFFSLNPVDDVYNNNFTDGIKINEGLPNANFGYPCICRSGFEFYYTYYKAESISDTTTASIHLNKLEIGDGTSKFDDLINII